jgi:carboxyl-terminal processing protease
MTNRLARVCLCTATLLVADIFFNFGAAAFGPTSAEIGTVDRVEIATKIYSAVRLYFAHGQGIDIDQAYRQYLNQIVSSPGRKAFDLATLKFVGTLKNGHTRFVDDWLNEHYGQPLPFWVENLGGQWVVTSSEQEDLPRGSVVSELDGVAIDKVMNEQMQYVSASNERIARSHVMNMPFLFPDTFVVTLENGTKVRVERGASRQEVGQGINASEGRWLVKDQMAYIKIPSFGDPNYEQTALALESEYRSASSLVIDVRGNGGGVTPLQLIGALMNQPWRTWNELTPRHIALFEAQGRAEAMLLIPSRTVQPAPQAYSGRLVFVVDRYCGSACEDLVMPFKDNGRATIIGETTQGSTGQPYQFQPYEGMTFMLGTVRCNFPDGSQFESVGITPTIAIEASAEDIVENRDPVLAKAEEVAKE